MVSVLFTIKITPREVPLFDVFLVPLSKSVAAFPPAAELFEWFQMWDSKLAAKKCHLISFLE